MKNQKQISVNRSRRCALLSPTTPLHVITYIFLLLLLLLPRVPPATAQPSNQRPPYGGVNPNFKPSMAVTITVLAAAFVFIALFSLYIRRCSRDTHMTTNGTLRGIAGRSRRAPRGLNPTVIETFPTFAYSEVKGLKIGKGTLECAVCLNEFEDDETLRLLPKCDHVFHPQCIDAWLSSHTTCPVCRADLESVSESEPVEKTGQESAEVPGGIGSAAETRSPEVEIDESQEQVLIRVNDDSTKDSSSSQPDVINPSQIPSQNRPVRSKSTRARIGEILKFPRSHSTGHSLVQPGENFDRFTLRLPEEVRKQILSGKLNRSTSCVTFVTRQGSVSGSRHGYRSGSDGGKKDSLFGRFDRSGKSDRWGFSMAPPFFWRNPSVRASKKGGDGSVKSPFDCMGAAKTDESEQSSSARPPV